MKKINVFQHFLPLILMAALLFLAGCQKEDTDDLRERYYHQIASKVDVTTVVYSDVYQLEMDIYEPAGDKHESRPVVILAHGGGFLTGSKTNPGMVALATDLAERGYVAASINYRLGNIFLNQLDSVFALITVLNAVSDGRAAVRFFRKNFAEGNAFRIDTNQIFFGGSSAGAMLAMHVGFLDNNDVVTPTIETILQVQGGIEGNSGNFGYSSRVKAIINLAGAIKNVNYLDNNTNKSILSFHGVDDDVVPFDCGHLYLGTKRFADRLVVCGSNAINQHAKKHGLKSSLNTYQGKHLPWKNHESGNVNDLFYSVEQEIFLFLLAHLN